MWTDTHSILRRQKNLSWKKTIVIAGWSNPHFQHCRMSLQSLSIPGLALKYKNVSNKLWEIEFITKQPVQVSHWQNKINSKREGPKITYTAQKYVHASKACGN